MNDVEEKILVSTFERQAEKCKSKDDIIKLCKSILNKHDAGDQSGISVSMVDEIRQKIDEHMTLRQYGGPPVKDPHIFEAGFAIDAVQAKIQGVNNNKLYIESMREAFINLGAEMLQRGYIQKQESYDPQYMERRYILRLGAYKL